MKHRLLGHWGTSPALSFVWVHLNRMIVKHDLDVIFVAGPGHGAPGVLGPAYLEGTYSEIYPDKSEDVEGMQKFFKQFSFPGHIGSHVTPETPGSIHEGGELGYSLSHAYGMALDNPNLIVACIVGDGEAETGPLATATPNYSLFIEDEYLPGAAMLSQLARWQKGCWPALPFSGMTES